MQNDETNPIGFVPTSHVWDAVRCRLRASRCIVRLPLPLRLLIFLCSLALAAPGEGASRVLAVDVDSIVHPVTVEIVSRALDQAERQHYDLVLIRLNTPGGLMDAMREIVKKSLPRLFRW